MSNFEFSDGMKRVLRSHPALPTARTRELAGAFTLAQSDVCVRLGALSFPLERVMQELKAGHLGYFREGSDQDRKRNSGTKSSYRFAGFTPSHVEEFDRRRAALATGAPLGTAAEFTAWQGEFLMGFTFEVIEQVALRAEPAPADLAALLRQARRIRDEILTGNLLLVAKMAFQRSRFYPTMVLDDLFTAGTDGLMIAIGRYDSAVGQFSTYATPWVKMAIDRFVAKTRHVIRIPIGLQEKVRKQRKGAEGAAGGQSEDAWMIPEVQSMEEPVAGFGDSELRVEDLVSDPQALRPGEAVEQADIARILHERVLRLDGLKQFVLAMRNDVGDACVLGARLFRDEVALSLERGRATCAAAAKTFVEPAHLCLISEAVESAAATATEQVPGELVAFAMAG